MSDEWIVVALEEYKTLRQESLASIEQMQRTVQIGLVAIGVLTAFGVDAAKDGPSVQVGLAISTPLVAALVVAVRLDELHRVVKAGAHIAGLEQRIARRMVKAGPPLTWESDVQAEFIAWKDNIRHWTILFVLFAAAAPAIALGMTRFAREHEWEWVLAGAAVPLALASLYQWYMLRRVASLHKTANNEIEKIRRGENLEDRGQSSPAPNTTVGKYPK